MWDEMRDFIKRETRGHDNDMVAIGSGGNINKIFSMSKRKEGKSLNIESLKNYYKEFSSFSLADRMQVYKLREDRADVIVPALLIHINVMRWANISEIFVPKIGLADGLIQHLYQQVTEKSSSSIS
jgi:exopolyphosphatase/guanosine-5'-triphosphate,3'-diphosphate pyrophosphatase